MSRADQLGDFAAQFIIAQEDGPWGEAEQAALDAWLAESDGNRAAYWRLRHSWRAADRIGALGEGRSGYAGGYRPPRLWIPVAVAASLVAAIGLGWTLSRPFVPRDPAELATRIETPVGGRKIVDLTDGSKIELNTASVIRAAVEDGRREIWLDQGEAYFDVKHVAGRPFVVHAGNRRITVLGTKFSVRRRGEQVTVSVVEGKVRVDEMEASQPVRSAIITGGDVALARDRATVVVDRSVEAVETGLAWRGGMLNFDRTRLADAAEEFNRYNRKPVMVVSGEAAELRIGGMFPSDDPQAFARLMRDAYGLRIEETPGTITITD